MAEERILKRNEVLKENTWAVEDIFPSDQAWNEEYETLKALPEKAAAFKGTLGRSAADLLAYFKQRDEISYRMGLLFNYASRMEVENKQAFLEFTEAQRPVCYNDFFSAAIPCVKPRHREGLRHLLEFKLKRHPRYNLETKRMKLIEMAIRQRAARLLEG